MVDEFVTLNLTKKEYSSVRAALYNTYISNSPLADSIGSVLKRMGGDKYSMEFLNRARNVERIRQGMTHDGRN